MMQLDRQSRWQSWMRMLAVGIRAVDEPARSIVVNAHDSYSAYNMMAGVRSPMAQHGRIPRDPREPRTRNTAPW
jgi:hypothetical protein